MSSPFSDLARIQQTARARGYTLIEMLIVMVIISILAAVAIPSYSGFATRGRLTDATGTLASFRLRMEQSYQDNGNFGAASCAVAIAASPNFNFACVLTNGGQGFTATATGVGATAGYQYSIDEAGQRQTLAFPGVGASACWVIRAGSCS